MKAFWCILLYCIVTNILVFFYSTFYAKEVMLATFSFKLIVIYYQEKALLNIIIR